MPINPEYCPSSSSPSHWPVRSSLARAVLSKIDNDRCLQRVDRSRWYRLSRSDLLRDEYRQVFFQFDEDEDTAAFIKKSEQTSDQICLQILQSFLTSLLTLFMTRTSANGLLGRGQMFVYSTSQFRTLLDIHPDQQSPFTSLLDIGAGDGSVTDRMSSLFDQIYVTEISPTMKWRLANRGYTVLNPDQWGNRTFDVITCLNVLDRCEKPWTLLQKIRAHLHPQHGRLIVSLVLPLKQYFEYSADHRPDESIQIEDRQAEKQINYLLVNVFEPLGFRLKRFTRLPYLCEGDLQRSYYLLSDYSFVLEIDPVS